MVFWSLQKIDLILSTATLFFAYLVSVVAVGAAEAYVAKKAGDDTAEQMGFLSGNPWAYVDVFGLLCTMLIGFGWGKLLPFNPHNVTGKHRLRTVFLVYLSRPIFSLLLAFTALISNVFLVGTRSLQFAFWTIFSKNVPLQQLATVYPDRSSLTLIIVLMLLSIIAINTFIATWSLINNMFYYILFLGAERDHNYMKHADVLAFFGPLLVLIFFTGPLRFIFLKAIIYLAYVIASWCGACA